MVFTVVLDYDPEEDVFNVSVPSLPGCYTWGKTRAEAISNAEEVIGGFIQVLKDFGDPIPEEADIERVRIS